MLICGFDVETTGLDFEKDRIIEIGAVLYDVSGGVWRTMQTLSFLVYDNTYPMLTPFVQRLTGISDELLKKDSLSPADAFTRLEGMFGETDYIVAHNEQFDRQMLKGNLERYSLNDFTKEKKWLCSIQDIEYPDTVSCRKLSHIAVDLDIDFKPKDLHRALDDVVLMGRVLENLKLTPESMYKYQQEPWVYVVANTEKPWIDDGKSKDEAKNAGYSWQQIRGDNNFFDKKWVKRIKENKFEEYKKTEYSFTRTTLEI